LIFIRSSGNGGNVANIDIRINRRKFMQWAGVGVGALALLPHKARGEGEAPICPTPEIRSTIERNHGHLLAVDLAGLKANGPKTYSIMGASGHDHLLELNESALLALFLKGVVEIESQVGAGHVHMVRIELV
jgi:hypothetical protein